MGIIKYCLLKDNTISSEDFKEFEQKVPIFLKDIETKYEVTYKRGCVNCSHLHVILASALLTNSIFKTDEKINFSWTDQSCNVIMFCYDNWKYKYLEENKPTNELYKKYVVQHEFLHAFPFYLDHNEDVCNKENKGYNVMYQQTRNASDKGVKPKQKCEKKIIDLPDIKIFLKNEFEKLNNKKEKILIRKTQLLEKIQKQSYNKK